MAALAACGSSSTPTPAASHRPAKHAAVAVGGCLMSVATNLSVEPTVSVPASAACTPPPTKLEIADAIPGQGPAAKAGDSLDVKYVGLHWTNRQPFDASWNNGPTNTFTVSPLGTASVIDGWNQGLIGARTGDRRVLAIPSSPRLQGGRLRYGHRAERGADFRGRRCHRDAGRKRVADRMMLRPRTRLVSSPWRRQRTSGDSFRECARTNTGTQ